MHSKVEKEIRCSVCNSVMMVENTKDGIAYRCPNGCESSTEIIT